MMPKNLSFVDIIGIIGFIWSLISFYIGYLWYKEGATKDALIARLTAENELLRQEVQAISSDDDGRKQKELTLQRTIDRRGLDRLNQFYRSAFSYSRSTVDAFNIYRGIVLALAITMIIVLFGYGRELRSLSEWWWVVMPPLPLVLILVLVPFFFLVRAAVANSRLGKVRILLDQEGFSFQEVLTAKSWMDQQEWNDRKLKDRLGRLLNVQLTELQNLGTRSASASAAVSTA